MYLYWRHAGSSNIFWSCNLSPAISWLGAISCVRLASSSKAERVTPPLLKVNKFLSAFCPRISFLTFSCTLMACTRLFSDGRPSSFSLITSGDVQNPPTLTSWDSMFSFASLWCSSFSAIKRCFSLRSWHLTFKTSWCCFWHASISSLADVLAIFISCVLSSGVFEVSHLLVRFSWNIIFASLKSRLELGAWRNWKSSFPKTRSPLMFVAEQDSACFNRSSDGE